MGGTSTSQQKQQSETNPYAPAIPALNGILGQLQGNLSNTGVTANENSALNSIVANAGNASQFSPQISSYANELLAGGGANAQAGNINQNYLDYQRRLNPTADGVNIGGNSALKPYLDTLASDITNQVNGSFAAAGRDFSGANQMALGRGISSGLAPVIANQYNTDVSNQRSAADALFNGGNTNAGLLAGLQQQSLANKGQGVTVAGQAIDSQNAQANATLQAEAARRGIPVQALGLLAQIGIPIAGLGGTSSGTATGSQTMSGADQFNKIAGGVGGLFKSFLPFGL